MAARRIVEEVVLGVCYVMLQAARLTTAMTSFFDKRSSCMLRVRYLDIKQPSFTQNFIHLKWTSIPTGRICHRRKGDPALLMVIAGQSVF
jgi:hypothetical protein